MKQLQDCVSRLRQYVELHKHSFIKAIALVSLLSASRLAFASDEFQGLIDKITELLQGGFGTSIALGAFLLGMLGTIATQRITPLVIGISSAVIVSYGPDIITALVGAPD